MDRRRRPHARHRSAAGSLSVAIAILACTIAIAVAITDRIVHHQDTAVQASRLDITVPVRPLRNQHGAVTSLARYRGRIVVVAPFLTLCAELCPLTTGVLRQVDRRLRAAGLRRRVALLEVSVDPWRDSPWRLRAYRRMVGARWPLLTGSLSQLRAFWAPLGVAFKRTTTVDRPPPVDWASGRPQTMDVEHTNGFFVLGTQGHLRALGLGMADVGGRLPAEIGSLLGPEGRDNLRAPHEPWSAATVLHAVAEVLGHPIDVR